mmetsp:Transcript_22457/g.35275  ORF Transcript_22457/g.35275 Transcript_22457/m.35275 type:complete len:261 (+) Transcript_22457:44-826(+)
MKSSEGKGSWQKKEKAGEAWTDEEESELIKLYNSLGSDWPLVTEKLASKGFPKRSSRCVQQRRHTILRRIKRRREKNMRIVFESKLRNAISGRNLKAKKMNAQFEEPRKASSISLYQHSFPRGGGGDRPTEVMMSEIHSTNPTAPQLTQLLSIIRAQRQHQAATQNLLNLMISQNVSSNGAMGQPVAQLQAPLFPSGRATNVSAPFFTLVPHNPAGLPAPYTPVLQSDYRGQYQLNNKPSFQTVAAAVLSSMQLHQRYGY